MGNCTLTSSLLSLCDVISADIIGIPSKNHDIFAAQSDDHFNWMEQSKQSEKKERIKENNQSNWKQRVCFNTS